MSSVTTWSPACAGTSRSGPDKPSPVSLHDTDRPNAFARPKLIAPGPTLRKACGNESSIRSCRRRGSIPAGRPCGTRSKTAKPVFAASGEGPKPALWTDRIGAPACIRLRRLEDGDSLEHLTDLLHRAFSRIGAMGIPCSCMNQPAEVTRQRISRGECFVALSGELIVGTVTLYPPDANSDSGHYRNASVGTLRQLAVDPRFHGRGIGSALLRLAENWALQRGYRCLALDTPELADHLIGYYRRQGFGVKETLQFAGRPYRSVVFSKAVADCKIANRRRACRTPAHRGNPVRATANAYAAPWPVPIPQPPGTAIKFAFQHDARKDLAAHGLNMHCHQRVAPFSACRCSPSKRLPVIPLPTASRRFRAMR